MSSEHGYVNYVSSMNASSFSVESLRDSIRDLEWLKYEVDPAWAKFCEFGPADIGGVWEELGVIRRRPQYTALVVNEAVAARIAKMAGDHMFDALYGIPMHVVPLGAYPRNDMPYLLRMKGM